MPLIGGGHLGVEKTVDKLKECFYWPGHYSDVQNWCATCSSCVARKTAQPHQRGGLQPVTVGYPLQMVAVDIMGPFSSNCKWKLLHVSDSGLFHQMARSMGYPKSGGRRLLHKSY